VSVFTVSATKTLQNNESSTNVISKNFTLFNGYLQFKAVFNYFCYLHLMVWGKAEFCIRLSRTAGYSPI